MYWYYFLHQIYVIKFLHNDHYRKILCQPEIFGCAVLPVFKKSALNGNAVFFVYFKADPTLHRSGNEDSSELYLLPVS